MKKIVSVLQVFALITILPLCAILERNHATMTLTDNNTGSEITEKVNAIGTDYPQVPEYKMEIPCLLITIKAIY